MSKNNFSFGFNQNSFTNEQLQYKALQINGSLAKRFFDIAVSICFLLFIFSWLYPIIAIAIKLETKGLAMFVQDRIGLNGKIFKCYKFRTLLSNSNSLDKDSLPLSYTTPATKVGVFLRKYNLDELPQFINVLKGNMSIIGPRPHAVPFHNLYSEYVPNIHQRLLVKPGITGLSQINGLRGDVEDIEQNKKNIQQRVQCDTNYIFHWSFKLDLKIFVKTFIG
ncbi:MAG TPA: sugar transferase [Chitinophagaceae bacterium]|nr:sugar transferase [Chitinophagaceae bacterium]MCC6635954.1 sugar transferase [Chitinophagaceae bacterium]HMZ45537.1 sugar transferase [Chitinophagaceae bacterium]HNE92959.1 sugar transferase [Chitinophagaceae bacterium]HNF28694.1 sugar transferase [Chitinophagaceae bacterium]